MNESNMSWTNYHCHTEFCDARSTVEAFVNEAIDNNVSILGFSGHAPAPFKSRWNIDPEVLNRYFTEVNRVKETYAGKIKIYCGLEADFIENSWSAHSEIISSAPTDYIIGSIHYLAKFEDGEIWAIDGPDESFDKGVKEIFGNDIRKLVKTYCNTSLKMLELGGFEIVGHIDKIYQHGKRYFDINEPWYTSLMNEVIHYAIEKDYIIEINTKSIDKLGILYPHKQFFKTLKNNRARITINSDTHDSGLMVLGMQRAARLLNEAGLTSVTEFINNQWIQCPFSEKGIITN